MIPQGLLRPLRLASGCLSVAVACIAVSSCAPKDTVTNQPAQGWHQVEPWRQTKPEAITIQGRTQTVAVMVPPADFTARYPPGTQLRNVKHIQEAFDRNAKPLFDIYRRELSEHRCAQGDLELALALKADGSVAAAEIVATNLRPEFATEVRNVVVGMNFGAKPGEGLFTTLYPVRFYPSERSASCVNNPMWQVPVQMQPQPSAQPASATSR